MSNDVPAAVLAWLEAERLPKTLLATIEAVHLPLATRIDSASLVRPIVVGICGAQGSGKSTLATVLALLLEAQGRKVATISLDDFYLARAEREHLAKRVHPLLTTRGAPGTHDVSLARSTLDSLAQTGNTVLPRFDKSRDEPFDPTAWPSFAGPADVVVFEGWCVGARPQNASALEPPINGLEREEDRDGVWRRYVNDQLGSDYAQLFASIDLQVFLQAPSFDVVHAWRWEQEEKLRERTRQSGGDVSRLMDESALRRFIAHYERLTRHLLDEMPSRADVLIELDVRRRVVKTRGL